MAEGVEAGLDVRVAFGQVVLELRADGKSIPFNIAPQAAFELGEKMARAAHEARHGEPVQSDESYLRDQIRRRTTEDYRNMLVRKFEVILNSQRENRDVSNAKLSAEFVDLALSRILPS